MAGAKYNGAALRQYIARLPDMGRNTIERTGEHAEASAKGRAAVRTGAMRDKTRFKMEGNDRGALYADAPYSAYVEYGTYKQAAQPWFTPGVEDAVREMPAIARQEFAP